VACHAESLGLWIVSIFRNFKYLGDKTFRKLDLFPSSCEKRETPILLGPFKRTNLNHWTSFSNYLEIQTIAEVHKPSYSVSIT
jgi:hypothetical protein